MSIPGYRRGDTAVPPYPRSARATPNMKEVTRFGEDDAEALWRSRPIPARFGQWILDTAAADHGDAHTLRADLQHIGEPREGVDAMQDAWKQSVLLHLTRWSLPYVTKGDF